MADTRIQDDTDTEGSGLHIDLSPVVTAIEELTAVEESGNAAVIAAIAASSVHESGSASQGRKEMIDKIGEAASGASFKQIAAFEKHIKGLQDSMSKGTKDLLDQ